MKTKTLINWLKGNLSGDCLICKDTIQKLENLPDGVSSFILTINKRPEFETKYHIGVFDKD